MKYQNYNYSDKLVVEGLLASPNEEIRSSAIVGMTNGISDVFWVQDKLIELVNDESFWVAKNAITALADLARIHGVLDLPKVKNALKEVQRTEMKQVVQSTLEDLDIFL